MAKNNGIPAIVVVVGFLIYFLSEHWWILLILLLLGLLGFVIYSAFEGQQKETYKNNEDSLFEHRERILSVEIKKEDNPSAQDSINEEISNSNENDVSKATQKRLNINDIEELILLADSELSGKFEHLSVKLLQGLLGVYKKSKEEQDVYVFLEESITEVLNRSSFNETKRINELALGMLQCLKNGYNNNEICDYIRDSCQDGRIEVPKKIECHTSVVEWPHTYVYGTDELKRATVEQQSYYKYFKEQFLASNFLDLEENLNYAFVLMFDLADHCMNEDELEELEKNLGLLGEHYPKTLRYIDQTLDKVHDRFLAKQSKEILSNLENTEDSTARWIKEGEEITVAGMKLTRGNFYLGNYLCVPKENIMYYSSKSGKYNFLGPVVNPNLEAKYIENASWSSFSSYSTMTKAIRFRYLSFLAGDISLSQIEPALLCVYLMGIEYRLFVDKSTTIEEKESLVKYITHSFINHRNITDEYGTIDMFSDLIDRALCNIMPINFKDLIGDYPIIHLKKFSLYLLDTYIGGGKSVPYGKAFDFATQYLDLLKGFPDTEENIEAVQKHFAEHLKEYGNYYLSEGHHSNDAHHTIERLGAYTYNFPLVRQESHEITYRVSYPNISLQDNDMWIISNSVSRIRYDSSKHWDLIRQNDGISTAYADMNFASYINPSSLPTLVKLASDIDAVMDSDGYALIEVNELVKWIKYPPRKENGIYKVYAQIIVEALKKMGYGIAPNPNVEGDRLMFGAFCCLFKLVDKKPLSRKVLQGQAVVKMASQIAMADRITADDIHLIESSLYAIGFEGNSLKYEVAYAKSYSSVKQNFYTSKIIQELNKSEIPSIYKLLLRMTFNGGDVSTERVKILKRYCKYLGQDPEKIHSGIHEAMTTDEFATVEKTTGEIRYAIPEPGTVKHKFAIDSGKLERMEKQTEQAQAMLSDIFVDEELPKVETNNVGEIDSDIIEILSKLLEKDVWPLAEVDELCKSKGLMMGYVLEKINDLSYEKVDDAVVDQDGDQVFVTTNYKEQLI